MNLQPSRYNKNVTDYTMHISLLNPQDTIGLDARNDGTITPLAHNQTIGGLYSIGPYEQWFGAWARKLAGAKSMQLKLDETFVQGLNGGGATVHVTYYDHVEGASFTVKWNGNSQTITLAGKGKWVTADIPVNQAVFTQNDSGAHLVLSGVSGSDVIFHMVEVVREIPQNL